MGDGVQDQGDALKKKKKKKEGSAHETDQPQIWCLFVTTKLETFFKQFVPT